MTADEQQRLRDKKEVRVCVCMCVCKYVCPYMFTNTTATI